MKRISKNWFIFSTIIGAFLLLTINCKKDETNKEPVIIDDSIPLMYIEFLTAVDSIDVNNDSSIDIVSVTVNSEFTSGANFTENYIKSINDNVFISYGGISKSNKEYLLDEDSIINNSLIWETSFVRWATGPFVPEKYNPDFIGIMLILENKTLYGWINSSFTKFAIDTAALDNNRNVLAGKIKK